AANPACPILGKDTKKYIVSGRLTGVWGKCCGVVVHAEARRGFTWPKRPVLPVRQCFWKQGRCVPHPAASNVILRVSAPLRELQKKGFVYSPPLSLSGREHCDRHKSQKRKARPLPAGPGSFGRGCLKRHALIVRCSNILQVRN